MIKNQHPLVEVLLVCFNSEGTIFRTLSSIDTQTYQSLLLPLLMMVLVIIPFLLFQNG